MKMFVTIPLSLLLGLSLLAGCDIKPSPPVTESGMRTEKLAVALNDAQEREAATAFEKARVNYDYRLAVLEAYYNHVGNLDKQQWAQRELKNLRTAQTFGWEGVPEVLPPEKGESVENVDERLLAEYVLQARKDYSIATTRLIALYDSRNMTYKASLMKNLLQRVDPVRQYKYILSAEIPGPDLKPTEVIPDADRLYEKAQKLFLGGKGPLHLFVFTSYDQERQAIETFMELIYKYPTSNKIALAAYYIADIYKEYFNEDVRAVQWYERAWQWDPNITEPARFQAAVVYDYRLHNRAKALELYRGSIQNEQYNKSNVEFSHRRIRELTEK